MLTLAIRNARQAIYNVENASSWGREECLEDALIALRELLTEVQNGL